MVMPDTGSLRHTLAAGEHDDSIFKELVGGACYACGIRTTHRSIAFLGMLSW